MFRLDDLREACAEVASRARFVEIAEDRLGELALEFGGRTPDPDLFDPAHHQLGSPEETLAYVITLDAINFGSGWFPHLAKRPGCSGYLSLAQALREHFEAHGPLQPSVLRGISARECAALLGQSLTPPIDTLMGHFARAWQQLGDWLLSRFRGDFFALVAEANSQVERMISLLAEMPMYRDEALYDGLRVPFYKRGQITCSDLSLAFEGQGPGHFDDLDRLTLFADNLVPHVLRFEGVLRYDPDLLQRIEAGALIESGSAEEVEIRAVALHAVESMVSRLHDEASRSNVFTLTAQQLDTLLWNRGQSPQIKAQPRHRTRSLFY